MSSNRSFIIIAAVAALLMGWQLKRKRCPACMILPNLQETKAEENFQQTPVKR